MTIWMLYWLIYIIGMFGTSALVMAGAERDRLYEKHSKSSLLFGMMTCVIFWPAFWALLVVYAILINRGMIR